MFLEAFALIGGGIVCLRKGHTGLYKCDPGLTSSSWVSLPKVKRGPVGNMNRKSHRWILYRVIDYHTDDEMILFIGVLNHSVYLFKTYADPLIQFSRVCVIFTTAI